MDSSTTAARLFLLSSNLGLEIFSPRLKLYLLILTKTGESITSKSHTHPSHSQTSRLSTSSLSLGVPVPRPTQCLTTNSSFHYKFSSQFKSKVDNILTKDGTLRINLNMDDTPSSSSDFYLHSKQISDPPPCPY